MDELKHSIFLIVLHSVSQTLNNFKNFVPEMDIIENIRLGLIQTTLWEWIAVGAGLLYVLLITYKITAAWFFAVLSSAFYIYLCYVNQLYLETGLQFFYLFMGFYGWYMWSADAKDEETPIIKWKKRYHFLNVGISLVLVIVMGTLFKMYTDQANPYTDAFTTIFSLTATFMVTQKVLENWIYWILIDAVSVYLFASRNLYMTALLFVLYTLIAIFGYYTWRKLYAQQKI